MTFCLEKTLDYYRFQNLFILNFILLCLNISVIIFEKNLYFFTLFLSILNVIFTLILFSKKCIEISKNKIIYYYSIFGIKLKQNKVLNYNNDTKITFKTFVSSNIYQKKIKYEPSLHVKENFYEIFIDGIYLLTLNSEKSFSKLIETLNLKT